MSEKKPCRPYEASFLSDNRYLEAGPGEACRAGGVIPYPNSFHALYVCHEDGAGGDDDGRRLKPRHRVRIFGCPTRGRRVPVHLPGAGCPEHRGQHRKTRGISKQQPLDLGRETVPPLQKGEGCAVWNSSVSWASEIHTAFEE